MRELESGPLSAKGGGCSSGTGSASASAATASASGTSAGTAALSVVASSYVSATSSASTWIDGGGSGVATLFAKGVPQSKQNLAAGGLRAAQFAQGLSGERGMASTGGPCFSRVDGGGAGGGRRAGREDPVIETPGDVAPPTWARPVEGGGGTNTGTANGSGGVLSEGEPWPARAVVSPASAASSSEMARARSSCDMVSGAWEGGVKASGGVLSAAGWAAPSGAPQLLQEACPGTL